MPRTRSVQHAPTSWDEIATAIEGLPRDQRGVAAGVVAAATRGAVAEIGVPAGPWYLRQVTVQGHAGIGEKPVTLTLTPAPGLTIVTARNGTGKSSLVDGVRWALSNGEARRFDLVDTNVHFGARRVAAEVTNGPDTVEIVCEGSTVTWSEAAGRRSPMPKAWVAGFQRFLPVLLYSELSPLITHPADLHDFLQQAIDLTTLLEFRDGVDEIKLAGGKAERELKLPWQTAVTALTNAGLDATAAAARTAGAIPDKATMTELRAAAVALPTAVPARAVAAALWTVDQGVVEAIVADVTALETARSGAVSGMQTVQSALDAALRITGDHADELRAADRCPVCHSVGLGWVDAATAESRRLSDLLTAVTAAQAPVVLALDRLNGLLPSTPPAGLEATLARVGDKTVTDQLARWRKLRADADRLAASSVTTAQIQDLVARSTALLSWYAPLAATIEAERDAQVASQAKVAQAVTTWLDQVDLSREAISRGATAGRLATEVEGWIKAARAEIFEPIGAEVQRIFEVLNVDGPLTIGPPTLTGGTRQAGKVRLSVDIEGTSVGATTTSTAILSTGQRNALSLASYLPRAAQPSSPFGFLVLDDAIHAFDTDRVTFLARELIRLAEHYQIVVLTHDDRLWRAVKALGARPTHVQLRREVGKRSEVTVTVDERPGDVLLDQLDSDLKKEGGRPLGTADARLTMALAMCRQAVDTEVSTQLDIFARTLGVTDERFADDRRAAPTTRGQLELLNRYAVAASRPELDLLPFDKTIEALNDATHGDVPRQWNPSQASKQCRRWLDDCRQLVALVAAMGV